MSVDVFGVGNALVDFQVHVDDGALAELKYAKGIMTLVDESAQSQVLEKVGTSAASRCAGGSATNTMMGIADFGGRAACACKVANDDIGRFFLEDMRARGVTTHGEPSPSGRTGTCVVLITSDAQRTMLTNLAVSATLSPDDIAADQMRGAKYIYIEGYLFAGEPTRSAALKAIDTAKSLGIKVAFTVSDPFLIQYHRDEFWSLIEGPVDLLFCNLEEARALTGSHDAVDCAQEIHRHADNVALTLGSSGSLLMHDGQAIPIEGIPVPAVDTTGAGDMYAAGILYGITNGLTWRQSGRLASHAAARIVAQMGARLPRAFTKDEVRRLADG